MIQHCETLSLPRLTQIHKANDSSDLSECSLTWRQQKLLVRAASQEGHAIYPPTQNQDWLADCLYRSPIKWVKLDLELGEACLQLWANSCQKTPKSAYVRVPPTQQLPHKYNPLGWYLKRFLDWFIAALLLMILSPLMLAIATLIRIESPGPILFRQWRIGKRGQLFQIIKFRTMAIDAERYHHQVMMSQKGLHKLKDDPRMTRIGRWLRQYSLDELPQLWNVLRGEMSLVGPRPWALYDAVRVSQKHRSRFNALPGITGAWQVEARSHLLDLDLVNQRDLHYLCSWSLWQDLRLLLLTIPRVISGFGAF